MNWTELYQRGADAGCDLLVVDGCVRALAASRSASLHAWVTAELPTARALCAALDAHGVAVADDVEAQVARRYSTVMFGMTDNKKMEQTLEVESPVGSSRPAVA